jgi:hypothetical protein
MTENRPRPAEARRPRRPTHAAAGHSGGEFLDWLLVGILASAIGALFGLDTFSPADQGDRFRCRPT